MTTTINASPTNGLVQTADGSGVIKVQSNGVTTNALAWVNFSGATSPGTIRSQYNVSSVTRNATGDFTVNFTTALTDANYAITGSCNSDVSAGYGYMLDAPYAAAATTSAIRIATSGVSAGLFNCQYISVAIFGN